MMMWNLTEERQRASVVPPRPPDPRRPIGWQAGAARPELQAEAWLGGDGFAHPAGLQQASSSADQLETDAFASIPPTMPSPRGPCVQILWCQAEAEPAGYNELLGRLLAVGIPVASWLVFDDSTKFCRWLFKQPRGAVPSDSVLVSGWRETKPCAMALRAARSGDVSALRPDARRSLLLSPVVSTNGDPRVHLVVDSVVVSTSSVEQRDKAQSWISKEGKSITNTAMLVVCGDQMLFDCVEHISRRILHHLMTIEEQSRLQDQSRVLDLTSDRPVEQVSAVRMSGLPEMELLGRRGADSFVQPAAAVDARFMPAFVQGHPASIPWHIAGDDRRRRPPGEGYGHAQLPFAPLPTFDRQSLDGLMSLAQLPTFDRQSLDGVSSVEGWRPVISL